MSEVTEDGRQTPDLGVDLVRLSPRGEPLSPFLVMLFYSKGIFSWLFKDGRRMWWSPEPRSVLILPELHISRSLRKTLKSGKYHITADTRFEEVVQLCRLTRDESWITDELYEVYVTLHRLGHAHSIEVWEGDQLVGGLYGVCIGELFCGCSMFHTATDASKVALVKLAEVLGEWRIPLIDCQVHNPHLQRMGARVIPRDTFHKIAGHLVRQKRRVGSWTSFFT
jgi:leucyl/phenylalanyl-tRNA--protein transferase